MSKHKVESEMFSEIETAARRDAALKRMLTMPPKPHKELVESPKDRPTNPRSRAERKSA